MEELLKSLDLNEETINKIIQGMKESKIYTSKEENLDIRYGKLKNDFDSKNTELTEANKLIAELKKSNKGNEDLQNKITEYETQVTNLQIELEKEKVDNAVKIALLESKVSDVDYITFKLKEKGEVKLDENGKIKDWENTLKDLKTQFPNQFESSSTKKIDENKLLKGEEQQNINKSDFLKMPYKERLKFYNENPKEFNKIMNEE